jgi:hypothetical protein
MPFNEPLLILFFFTANRRGAEIFVIYHTEHYPRTNLVASQISAPAVRPLEVIFIPPCAGVTALGLAGSHGKPSRAGAAAARSGLGIYAPVEPTCAPGGVDPQRCQQQVHARLCVSTHLMAYTYISPLLFAHI